MSQQFQYPIDKFVEKRQNRYLLTHIYMTANKHAAVEKLNIFLVHLNHVHFNLLHIFK